VRRRLPGSRCPQVARWGHHGTAKSFLSAVTSTVIDMTTTMELLLTQQHGGVAIRSYTSLLDQVLLALEELDRVAVPGRASRPEWAVRDVSTVGGQLRLLLSPRTLPRARSEETLAQAGSALVAGVLALSQEPEIPVLFSETTVMRIDAVGNRIGRGGVAGVGLTSLNGVRSATAYVSDAVQRNAAEAVEPATVAYSSLVGKLDVISARRERRRIGLLTEAGRPVLCDVQRVPRETILEAFEQQVIASGKLRRNSRGQPVRLDVDAIEAAPGAEPVTARDLLGAAPELTAGLSAGDYMAVVRGR